MDDTGVVDENVEIAERAARLCDDVLGALRVADVGSEEAGVAKRASGGFACGGIDIGDGDARPLRDVAPGDRKPDAARGASDDRHLVLQSHAALREIGRG